MAEYIEREALIKKLNEAPAYFDSGDIRYGIDIAIQQVIEQPTADVVKVVRCKDCQHFIPDEMLDHTKYPNDLEADGLCDNIDKYTDIDHYCSYGELKEREG